MRRIITNLILILYGTVFAGAYSFDVLEDLIENERVESEPQAPEGELPPAYLLGDDRSVRIYSWAVYGGEPSLLCEPLPYDELIDISDGRLGSSEMVLNMKFPRVREAVEKSCLIRPGDNVLAVSAGAQSWVPIREFRIRRERAFCSEDSPYSLIGRLNKKLDAEPLFFATSADLKEGENSFRPVHFSRADAAPLKDVVLNVEEYNVFQAAIDAPNVDTVYFLARRVMRPEDDGFPSEILLWQKGEQIKVLTQEQVDSVEGSGRIMLEGILDYNHDEQVDLWIRGEQKKCTYRLLYQGTADGFIAVPLPNIPCSC